ncbi:TonB-dependent receptor [Labilibaculum sp. DW002]|uniref:TonB-dependent receptor n=1 Tax=Paralabilibaculum antarcticum TaxID=2912572 RepID=A0ABT5VRP5_9BACT|nr:TonB-dependent receptor [Labilibaculum sp. DW002]MDE5418100.1 TonB-dependent receptor [Labilibaculum sp. DW002]
MKNQFLQITKKSMAALLIFLAVSVPLNALAQTINVNGKVTMLNSDEGIPGVSVVEKGSTNGTVTDINGQYVLEVSTKGIIQFSFVGFKTQEIPVNGLSTVNVVMEEDSQQLDQVVVTGYQSKRKADLTGAVAIIDMKEAVGESNASVLGSIQGRVAGVSISSDGSPGGDNTSVSIRGFSTINDNSPLYVIDGVPTETGLNSLNPGDIESIQVLKDAASASIYGSRASNGVIVITTKQGKKGKLDINFDSYVGVQTLRDRLDVLNAKEWGEVYWAAQGKAGQTPSHPQYGNGAEPVMPSFIDEDNLIPAGNTDWVDEVFDPALMQYYNLSLNSKTEKTSVFWGTSYLNQDGIMMDTGYKRITSRLNTMFKPAEWLTLGENMMISYSTQVEPTVGDFTHTVLFQHPLIPIYDVNGNYAGPTSGLGDKSNPVRVLNDNKDNKRKKYRIFGNAFAEAEIISGLKFKTSFGIDYINNKYKNFEPKWSEGTRSVDVNYLTEDYAEETSWTWTNTLTYNKKFGIHAFSGLLGYEAIHFEKENLWGRTSDFLIESSDFRYLNAGTGESTSGGIGDESSLLSYFGKLDYVLDNKYLASFTLRRDGSSRLGADNRTGYFPAFSFGWRLSEESFLSELEEISNLKLRFGYGKTGNQKIATTAAYTTYAPNVESSNYNLSGDNSTPSAGYSISSIGNSNVRWETTKQTNIGIDLGLLNNRIDIVADYFIKETSGMLINPPMMSVSGEGNAPWINSGKMENSGIEMNLNYHSDNSKELTYDIGLNFSALKNKVTKLTEGNDFYDLGVGRIVKGKPVSVFYGYVADGLFRSIEEINSHATQDGLSANDEGLGRIRYKDLNNDGVVNDQDRTYIGDPHPDFTFGVNMNVQYKNFDFSAFIEGVSGRDIYNVHKQMTDFTYWNFNHGTNVLNAWTPENSNSNIPAVTTSNINNEFRTSTYFVEDGSYIKLKSIVLGYTLPNFMAKKIGASKVRFYLQGQNLLTLTDYTGMDYEVGASSATSLGIDSQLYPHTKNFMLGVNVNF